MWLPRVSASRTVSRMNGALLRHAGSQVSIGLDLGQLRAVTPHTGIDRDPLVDITFQHGQISMSSAMLRELSTRGTEALIAQHRERRTS